MNVRPNWMTDPSSAMQAATGRFREDRQKMQTDYFSSSIVACVVEIVLGERGAMGMGPSIGGDTREWRDPAVGHCNLRIQMKS